MKILHIYSYRKIKIFAPIALERIILLGFYSYRPGAFDE